MRESHPEYQGPIKNEYLESTSDDPNLDLAAENLKKAIEFGSKKLDEKKENDDEVRS